MSKPVISVEGLCKQYRLGQVGSGTIAEDFSRLISKLRGKEDPFLKVGETNYRDSGGDSDFVWALQDINFKVNEGEVLGIIGKNGAGKSTLLKLLSRVTGPTKGTIKMRGRIASLLEVGTGFHPDMTGRENVYMNGTLMGMTRNEITKKLDEIVDFSGVERYLDTPVKRYSSGMKVRLGFAVAAHLESEILIVDEVLAVGDAEFQKKAIGKMQDVSSQGGRTVLFVSHNLTAVQNLCTKGLLIEDGKVHSDGELNKVIDKYLLTRVDNECEYFCAEAEKTTYIKKSYIQGVGGNGSSNIVANGSDMELVIEYVSQVEGQKGNMFVGIYTVLGEKLLHLGTPYGGQDGFALKSKGKLVCRIDNLPLVQGTYVVNLSMHVNGVPQDRVVDAYSFDVVDGDFFGCGKVPVQKESRFLIGQGWLHT